MKKFFRKPGFLSAPLFSPKGFLLRAGGILLLFTLMHLAGLRQDTSILSGTSPVSGSWDHWLTGLGLVYVMFYLSATLAVPILVMAALIFKWIDRRFPTQTKDSRFKNPTAAN